MSNFTQPNSVTVQRVVQVGVDGNPLTPSNATGEVGALVSTELLRILFVDGDGKPIPLPTSTTAVDYPPANQVDTITARNAAIAAALATLPAPVDTSAATLQPFPSYLQYGGRLTSVSGGYDGITLDLAEIGLTYADPVAIVEWLIQAIYFIQPNLGSVSSLVIDLGINALPNTEDILDAIATAITQRVFTDYGGGFEVDLAGGTNAAPTPATAHQDATLVLQLPDPIPQNAGTVLTGISNYASITIAYDSGITLAASGFSGSDSSGTYTLGVSDSPTMNDVVAELNALLGDNYNVFLEDFGLSGGYAFASDGTASTTDSYEGDYPETASGPAVVSNNPGVFAMPNASIAAIQAYNGSIVYTN